MLKYAKLRTDLISVSATIDNQIVYNIKDPQTGNYFRLREPEFWLIQQFDGITSYENIAHSFRYKFNLKITTEEIEQFVDTLEEQFFLENSRSEQELSRKSYRKKEKNSLFSKLLFIKIKAFNPGKLLDSLLSIYKPFHRLSMFLLQLVIILLGIVILLANKNYFVINLYDVFNLGSILVVILAIFILVTTHEFAHAVICRYYGGKVKEIGFLLLYFQLCFYCDLSDAWLFKNKKHRLAVTLAGPYFQLLLLSIILIIWRITINGSIINELARIIGVVAWITLLFNLNPLIKLDGYYLLSDWLDIPNLRKKSFTYFNNFLKRKILDWPIEKIDITSREKKIYLSYAVLAIIYSTLLLIYLFSLFAGFLYEKTGSLGLFLLIGILLYTLRSNFFDIFKGITQHLIYMKDILKKPFRLVSYIFLLLTFIILFFVFQFSQRVTGEISIQPLAEFNLLINDFGLLEKNFRRGGDDSESKSSYLQMASTELASLDLIPYVRDGQQVAIGDTLAVLISNQVNREIISEKSVLDKLESDLALLKSPPKQEEIDEALAEIKAVQAVYNQKVKEEKRYQELTEKKLISQEELETAQAAAKVAKAELENKKAKLQLLKSPPKPEEVAVIFSEIEKQKAKLEFLKRQQDAQSIITPISGTVIMHQDDEFFLSIVDNSKVEVLVPVTDFDINLIKLNQRAKLKVRSFIGKIFEGNVVHIPKNAIKLKDRSIFLISIVIDNNNNLLRKGMTGYAKIEVGTGSLFSFAKRKITSIVRVEFWSWW